MRKHLLFVFLLFLADSLSAQLVLSTPIGKYDNDYKLGTGGYFSYSLPVSDAADATAELGVTYFRSGYIGSTMGTISLKFGYRYTLNQTGFGFYVHPQAGYAFFGQDDTFYNAPVLAGGIGYLFTIGDTQLDVGLVLEAAKKKDFGLTFASFRIAHGSFLFGRKNRE